LIGLDVAVDVNVLVEAVYVAPETSTWFAEVVLATDRAFGYDIPVVRSQLDSDPVW
jgi:hypothetical protein